VHFTFILDEDLAAGRPPPLPPGGRRVATVGYFDGLHIGHQMLLRELAEWAREAGADPAVVTFDRHPQEVLSGSGPPRILSLAHKLLLLERAGVAAAFVLPFTRALSLWSPEDFVTRIIRGATGADCLLMGFDSAFGRGRQGTFAYLAERAEALGVAVRQAGTARLDGERVSSTLVREAIRAGDLRRLERLLGRRFSFLGRVVRGDGRGRTIGFPTANLDLEGEAVLPAGVYFAEAACLGTSLAAAAGSPGNSAGSPEKREVHGALVNIGTRPTFHGAGASTVVEVHLPGFTGDLYGEYLEVHFTERHRDEMKFPSAAALVAQIRADVAAFAAGRGGS
jgi:riboflavin kinase/FMN adenylyltransferase